ncbi:hypothetical protein PCK2_000751 [Pneumocystis canis]|nr:hypothetical protein PCK2_000751 [Pneumocystis canis]
MEYSMDDSYLLFLEKTSRYQGKKTDSQFPLISDLLPNSLSSSPIIHQLQSCYYSSETDEPFRVVFYEFKEPCFTTFLSQKIKISKHDIIEETYQEWDPLGDYIHIINMVQELSKTNDIKVYKLIQGTKEYIWILGWKIKEGFIGVHTFGVYS